jgi:hypothetical protein
MPIEARMPRLDEIEAAEHKLGTACELGEVISMQLAAVYNDENKDAVRVLFSSEDAWALSLLASTMELNGAQLVKRAKEIRNYSEAVWSERRATDDKEGL